MKLIEERHNKYKEIAKKIFSSKLSMEREKYEISQEKYLLNKKLEETEKELNLFSNVDINNINNNYNSSNTGYNLTGTLKNHNTNDLMTFTKNNNLTKNSFYLCKNNISEIKGVFDMKIFNLKSTKPSPQKNKHIHELFGNNKHFISDLIIRGIKSNTNKNNSNYNRNNSMNMLLDKKKMNLITKYLSNKKTTKRNTNSNNKLSYNNNNKDL